MAEKLKPHTRATDPLTIRWKKVPL